MKIKFHILLISLCCFPLILSAQCTNLFISEYVEGGGSNKYLEIFNPTSSAINLANYDLQIFTNGSAAAGFTLALSGTIAPNGTFVIENSLEALAVAANLSTASGVMNFNGDDAIALRNSGVIIDVIGQIGFDPGTEWGTLLQSTADNTLRRKTTIQAGDANGANAFDPTIEWDGFAINIVSGLGAHTMDACAVVVPPSSAGMILNEISNGVTGNQEYFEFVVIGSSASPTGAVDLSSWIIDDNNGDFEGLLSGVGIADGHARIRAGCLTSVKPGSIILIYNNADRNPLIPSAASDPTDANSDCIYIFNINDPCIEVCTSFPTSANAAYACGSYTVPGAWAHISLRNDGDAAQARKPDATFFHGFSYSDVGAPFPSFPAALGGGSAFNVSALAGTGANYFFNCGSYTNAANFSRGLTPTNETPGTANNAANNYFINAVRTGTYDYSNLANPANCGTLASLPCPTLLPIHLNNFEADKIAQKVLLNWKIESSDFDVFMFELQRSSDAVDFYTIASLQGFSDIYNYDYIDQEPMRQNYYRLKMISANGEVSYSVVKNVNFEETAQIMIYPNPLSGSRTLNIVSDARISNLQIYNALGQELLHLETVQQTMQLPAFWPAGFYTLALDVDGNRLLRKLVIE